MKFSMSKKIEYKLILLMVISYSSILIFPAYGPVLGLYTNQESGLMLSTLFLFTFSASIFLLPKFTNNFGGMFWKFFSIAAIILIILFPALGSLARGLTMIFTGLFTARVILVWTFEYLSTQIDVSYGNFFTAILFFSYTALYIFNAISPVLAKSIGILFPAAGFALLFSMLGKSFESVAKNPKPMNLPPLKYLFPVFLIYISAGITYSGIYPRISQFALFERYYNVLPFLVALPFAYWTHRKIGVKALLWTGISLLGFSFLFHIFELRTWNYLVIQTLLQAGWAFMNSFVWIFASDISRINRNPFYFSSTIATFLMGTSIGSAIFMIIEKVFPSHHIEFIGLIPLLGVLVFTQMINNDLKNDIANFESAHLEHLTHREKEVFLLLLENLKSKEIAEHMNISPNTLKKHCGNIYRKLDIENKTELIKVYGYIKKT